MAGIFGNSKEDRWKESKLITSEGSYIQPCDFCEENEGVYFEMAGGESFYFCKEHEGRFYEEKQKIENCCD